MSGNWGNFCYKERYVQWGNTSMTYVGLEKKTFPAHLLDDVYYKKCVAQLHRISLPARRDRKTRRCVRYCHTLMRVTLDLPNNASLGSNGHGAAKYMIFQ